MDGSWRVARQRPRACSGLDYTKRRATGRTGQAQDTEHTVPGKRDMRGRNGGTGGQEDYPEDEQVSG